MVGAGSGLSTSAGLTYSGPRFQQLFADFIERYHYRDMYTAGFYPYATQEEFWAYWSRHIFYNRYVTAPGGAYSDLLRLVKDKDYFVVTTNVDHQFQQAGFDKTRLFYMQGDYGLWQCAKPCCQKTYDNEETVRRMVREQTDMRIAPELAPRCPVCGGPMAMNLRCDETFVQDGGWYEAQQRYRDFLHRHRGMRVLFLELGVGGNTPGIIKYPFWEMTAQSPQAFYASVNIDGAVCPEELLPRAVCLGMDIGAALKAICKTGV